MAVAHGDLQFNQAAERCAHQMNVAQFERREEIQIRVGRIVDVVEPDRIGALAEPGVIRQQHPEAFGEQRQKGQPRIRAARTVQKQQRLPHPTFTVAEQRTGDGERVLGEDHGVPQQISVCRMKLYRSSCCCCSALAPTLHSISSAAAGAVLGATRGPGPDWSAARRFRL